MTREELEHAIRAACDVADDSAVYVFGSQAILGERPDAPAELRQSMEVDVAPVTRPEQADRIDGSLGELSQFHNTHGFYVHGLSIETATLPPGWQSRVVRVAGPSTGGKIGLCVEGHDLAASKLAAFRDKDRDFVRTLLVHALIDPTILCARISTLAVDEAKRARMTQWVEITSEDLGTGKEGV
ncbi:MAG: DUF6036 family nucleotidyltransferase [Gemmatimonadaceae bacterium]